MNNEETKQVYDMGQMVVKKNGHRLQLVTIIGEIEGHMSADEQQKTTKYEHLLPLFAQAEADEKIEGVLVLLNTQGGDVEAGLALAEMMASLSKPVVSLVLGGSHSIGVPLAVASDRSLIVPTATMTIHPVRMDGMILGIAQSFDYFHQIQNRILGFICKHSNISNERLQELMLNKEMLAKDIGTVLVGSEAVKEGIIDEVGGLSSAFERLIEMIDPRL